MNYGEIGKVWWLFEVRKDRVELMIFTPNDGVMPNAYDLIDANNVLSVAMEQTSYHVSNPKTPNNTFPNFDKEKNIGVIKISPLL